MDADSQHRILVTPEDLLGFEIDGRYRLDAIVGGGGMGVVYRTTQRNLNRAIAIKLLKIDEADGKHRLGRFKREIDIIAQLSHPNIVRVFDSGQDPTLGLHYIAMELVEGAALDEVMHGQRIRIELAIDIAHEVAAALTEPHRMGIVHRDIKPANVLLAIRSDDTVGVKVVDFGIARGASGGSSKITTTGVVVGSPMYMAPEVARGETLDSRTDLYSLGVLLYEMITGTTPFRGSTPVAIMLRHAVDDPPSLADSVDDDFAYPELVTLVDQLLSKERNQRPEDAKEVMRRLDKIRVDYGFGRVHVDSSKPFQAALAEYVRPAIPQDDESFDDADPYSATTPVSAERGITAGSDSFAGWLVSSEARTALTHTISGASSTIVDSAPTRTATAPPTRSPTPLILGGVVVIVLLLGAVFFALQQRTPPAEVELGATRVKPTAPPPVVAIDEPPEQPPAIVAAAPDVGVADADTAKDAATADEEPVQAVEPTTPKRAAEPADKATKTNKAEKKDDFDKGMQWLHKK